jgi:Methyltransferase domain
MQRKYSPAKYFPLRVFIASFVRSFWWSWRKRVRHILRPSAAGAAGASHLPARPTTNNILDVYLHEAPTPQTAVDIFKGEWSSRFPPPFADLNAGPIPLFQDDRLAWALAELGGIQGQTVLELGPLEAGHSYMLDRAGAASILAIEGNSRAFLKCLVAKEILAIEHVQFQCGDFIPYLESTNQQFDLLLASGVLYHMKDPIKLLRMISQHTRRTYIWTHYFEESIIRTSPVLQWKFPTSEVIEVEGRPVTLHRQEYLNSLEGKTYCGGNQAYSHWLTRNDLLETLRALGFVHIKLNFEAPDHPHGPALGLVATKD